MQHRWIRSCPYPNLNPQSLSIALHSGPEEKQINGHRRPHPDFVHFCYELQGGPAVPMSILALQRVAAVWRGEGSFEDRLLAAVAAAHAEGPGVWEQIYTARREQADYDREIFHRHIHELNVKAAEATSEGMQALRRKHIAEEIQYFCGGRFIESCDPIQFTDP